MQLVSHAARMNVTFQANRPLLLKGLNDRVVNRLVELDADANKSLVSSGQENRSPVKLSGFPLKLDNLRYYLLAIGWLVPAERLCGLYKNVGRVLRKREVWIQDG